MTKRKRKEIQRQNSIEIQKSREFVNRMCGNKKKYDTEMQAFSAGKFAFRDKYFRTYFCPYCNKWHLTTKEKK